MSLSVLITKQQTHVCGSSSHIVKYNHSYHQAHNHSDLTIKKSSASSARPELTTRCKGTMWLFTTRGWREGWSHECSMKDTGFSARGRRDQNGKKYCLCRANISPRVFHQGLQFWVVSLSNVPITLTCHIQGFWRDLWRPSGDA